MDFDPDDAAPHWLALQQAHSGFVYQQFALVRAWYKTISAAEGIQPCIVRIQADGETALLPLAIHSWHATRILRYAGGQHFNANIPLASPTFPWPHADEDKKRLLRFVAEEIGNIDLIALTSQPLFWDGRTHPLACSNMVMTGNHFYEGDLQPDFEIAYQKAASADRRKKARGKERRLADMGNLSFLTADNEAMARTLVTKFLEQKRARLHNLGIPNPFDDPATEAFLMDGATTFINGKAIILMQALTLNDEPIAIFGGTRDSYRYSGMFTSFALDDAIGRYSPGEHLLKHMVQTFCSKGLQRFDLGIGDARYKEIWCPRKIPIVSQYVALTPAGQILRVKESIRDGMRRATKLSPQLNRLVNFLRRR
ncbi:MAG: GNAT family N-acetyltransferase [Beijerinckiaceae bacterium]